MEMQQQFKLQPSHYFAAMLIAAHGVTVAALFPLTFPIWAKTALAFFVLLSLGYHLWREAWLSAPSACVALILEGDQIVLKTRGEEQLTGQILRDSLVTPYLTVLNVLPQDAHISRSVIILPDSLDAESFRQLRVLLKWGS
jgi:toxin CptA